MAPCRVALLTHARRRAVFTAAMISASACSLPQAISSSVRRTVGTEASSPNRSSWLPIIRKSLSTSTPSAIAGHIASTRHRSWTRSRSEASALRKPHGQADVARRPPGSAPQVCDTILYRPR